LTDATISSMHWRDPVETPYDRFIVDDQPFI
jgi:hypothetical protein